MRGRWLPGLTATAALVCLVIPVLDLISRHFRFGGDPWRMAAPLVYAAAVAFGLWFYRKKRRDLFILATLPVSLVVVVTAALAEVWGVEDWTALLLGLIVLAQSAAAAAWLRKVAREGEPS
jgi:NhaP-type Na+/H+ or K+/H+ antiporter